MSTRERWAWWIVLVLTSISVLSAVSYSPLIMKVIILPLYWAAQTISCAAFH